MENFVSPEIEVLEFHVKDVITTSSNYEPGEGGVGGGMGM